MKLPRPRLATGLCVAALLGLGLGLQLFFFERFPQPVLFGDPAGYLKVGDAFQDAVTRLGAGESVASAFERVRGYFYLLGTGVLFAALDAAWPGDLAAWRRVMAGFNTLAMLAAFLLGRRLAGHVGGGLAALALAAVYPPFAVQTGRLYPDPVTGALFTLSAWALLRAIDLGSFRDALLGGALLFAAGFVRTQIAPYLLLVAAVLTLATLPGWRLSHGARRVAAGFALGLAPLALCWGLVTWAVGPRDDVVQLGNVTFKTPYPMGYWMFLDSGGWPGTYRLKTEPYYLDLARAAESDPDLLRSKPRQYWFTLGWLAARPREALVQPLVNAYRLFERPANDYKWDYPFDYAHQVTLQRGVALLALGMLALTLAEAPARALALAFPLALLPLHALVFAWPRYNLPAMPIVLAAAGAFLPRVAGAAFERRLGRGPALALFAALVASAAAVLLGDRLPEAARATGEFATLALIAAPLAAAAALGGRNAPRVAALALALAAVLRLAQASQDPRWHERTLALGSAVPGLRQEIVLDAEAVEALRAADAVAVVLDLSVPRGDLDGVRLRVGGRLLPAGALQPTMPRLPESTSTGGRDWRGYPQWWAALVPREWLPVAAGAFEIALDVAPEREIALRADRFADQERFHEGPSLGDWPHYVPLKLEVDGDYRLPVRRPLRSSASRTLLVHGASAPRPYRGRARVRLVSFGNAAAGTRWTSAPTPVAPRVALGFFAWAGVRQPASLWVDGRPALDFVLSERNGEWSGDGFRLCQRARGDRGDKAYAAFVLEGPSSGAARRLEVRFTTAFARQRAYFVADPGGALPPPADFEACEVPAATPRVAGVATVEEASRNAYPEDTGPWQVTAIY